MEDNRTLIEITILDIWYYDTTIIAIEPKNNKQYGLALNQFIHCGKKDFKFFFNSNK